MSDITNAIKQICEEKNLSYEAVLETIESALAAAYRKDFGEKNQNIKVEFDPEIGKSKVFDVKTVVEDMPEEITVENEPEGGKEAKGAPAQAEQKPKDKKEEKIEEKKDVTSGPVAQEEAAEEIRKFNPKTELQLKDAKI